MRATGRRPSLRELVRVGIVGLVTILLTVMTPVLPASAAPDSKGADFWLTFPGNVYPPTLTLFITGDTATTGIVAIPGLAFSAPFSVTPGTVTSVGLPSTADLTTSDTVEYKGIHVTAAAEVVVYGLSYFSNTDDGYLGLPTDILGTEYIVLGYKNSDVSATEFAVVATANATTVTITPSVTIGARTAGVPYNIVLNQGQTYQLRTDKSSADLSGTIVTSDKPVAVFGGHQCANIPQRAIACDHVVEEMFPTASWGRNFVTMPLATRTGGDTVRFIASTDATTVNVNGATAATLDRGQLFEQIVTGPAHITADKPIMVAQYSNSSSFDDVLSDPFEMLIPPFEQFLTGYTVTTPATGYPTNFINVVAPSSAVGGITLDGVAIPPASFTAIGSSGFSGAQVAVAVGSHNLAGTQPFGAVVYGFGYFDSYGYPGGLSLAPIATVTTLTLEPKTAVNPVGTQHCVTATVNDQNGVGVAGVGVDFAVTGVNPTSGSATTEAGGQAQFCYMGANPGDDTITATVGTLSDTASKSWAAGLGGCPSDPPTVTGTAGPDDIAGTPGRDVIHGLAGNDRITGLGGDDIICGGPGDDELLGHAGDDQLYGGADKDKLAGGPANDKLFGGDGHDQLSGGDGNDELTDTAGTDALVGGNGDDNLNALDLSGGDTLYGGAHTVGDVCRVESGDILNTCNP